VPEKQRDSRVNFSHNELVRLRKSLGPGPQQNDQGWEQCGDFSWQG
jgi:hypothetical protein